MGNLPVLPPDRPYYDDAEWERRVNAHYEWRLDETAKYLGRGDEWFKRSEELEYFIGFCDTLDPRRRPIKPDPFMLFDIQRKALEMVQAIVENSGQCMVMKARDLGCTYMMCNYAAYLFCHQPNSRVVFTSRIQDDVDYSQSLRALLPKIRFILSRLPAAWGVEQKSKFMEILNPKNGASVQGSVGLNAARGDRALVCFADEASYAQNLESVVASLSEVSNALVFASTTSGVNEYHEMWEKSTPWDGTVHEGKMHSLQMHWYDDPRRDLAWYVRKREEAEQRGMLAAWSREVECNPYAALEGALFDAAHVEAAIGAAEVLGLTPGELRVGLDVGGTIDENALTTVRGPIVESLATWMGNNIGTTVDRAVTAAAGGTLVLDAFGVGAGALSHINRLQRDDIVLPDLVPFLGGEPPVGVGEEQLDGSVRAYANRQAEGYYGLARLFANTYRAITEHVHYEPDELISLPRDAPELAKLRGQLSQIQVHRRGEKLAVIKQPPGYNKSPDLADSLMMAKAPLPLVVGSRLSDRDAQALRTMQATPGKPTDDFTAAWRAGMYRPPG